MQHVLTHNSLKVDQWPLASNCHAQPIHLIAVLQVKGYMQPLVKLYKYRLPSQVINDKSYRTSFE